MVVIASQIMEHKKSIYVTLKGSESFSDCVLLFDSLTSFSDPTKLLAESSIIFSTDSF